MIYAYLIIIYSKYIILDYMYIFDIPYHYLKK